MSSFSINLAGAVAGRSARSVIRASARTSIVLSSQSQCTTSRSFRAFSSRTCQLWKTAGVLPNCRQFRYYQQRRPYSSTEGQQLKQVGFEDINTKLTASPSSTSSNIILVDVREPAELTATGIIPGAVSVPLASQPDAYFLSPDEFETRFGYPKPGFEIVEEGSSNPGKSQKEIVFYCKAGVRAVAAAQLAVQAGYDPSRISVYHGSWLDWMNKGGKVEKWEGNE